jgi:dolichyl-phosphate-mannose-protein mannosyltransferase
VTPPEKFYFDEVHDAPAARQMLEPVLPSRLLSTRCIRRWRKS